MQIAQHSSYTFNTSLGAVVVPSNFNSDSLITLGGGVSPPKEVVETFDGVLSLQLELKSLGVGKGVISKIMALSKVPTPLGNPIQEDDGMVSTVELIALKHIEFSHDVDLCSQSLSHVPNNDKSNL